TCVVYSSQGHQVVSGSWDETIRLWDAMSGQCHVVIENIKSRIASISWSRISDVNCFVAGYDNGNVCLWQVVENGDACHVRLRWRTVNGELTLTDTLIQDVRGLSRLNKQLLKQRGAKGEPLDRLRETSKKAMQMASVLSTFKRPSTKVVLGSASTDNLASDLPEPLEHPEASTQSEQP
ncbi:hypothetical protein BGX34_004126, partial [Mortierella sp. NVP85]